MRSPPLVLAASRSACAALLAAVVGACASGTPREPPRADDGAEPRHRADVGPLPPPGGALDAHAGVPGGEAAPPEKADAAPSTADRVAAREPSVDGGSSADAAGGGGGSASPGEPARPPGRAPDGETGVEVLPAGRVKAGWAQLDLGKEGYARAGAKCPMPDKMVTPGTVDYDDGVWTLTGSGEGFLHVSDQGNLVYLKNKVKGDFTFTARVERLEMVEGGKFNSAAQAVINAREDLTGTQPNHSVFTGIAPGTNITMARFFWAEGEKKWFYWPAWPMWWPPKRPWPHWIRLQRRGQVFSPLESADGKTWKLVTEGDARYEWFPYTLKDIKDELVLALMCSARNDANLAPKGPDGCPDPGSAHMRQALRCVFSNVTITQP